MLIHGIALCSTGETVCDSRRALHTRRVLLVVSVCSMTLTENWREAMRLAYSPPPPVVREKRPFVLSVQYDFSVVCLLVIFATLYTVSQIWTY